MMKSRRGYTYWIFYLKEEYHSSIPIQMYTDIYAYTDDKRYAKEFLKTKDPDKFICKKVILDRVGLNKLACQEPSRYLRKIKGVTKDEKYQLCNIEILLTNDEYSYVSAICQRAIMADIYVKAWTDPRIFKKKYTKALSEFNYDKIFEENCDGIYSCIKHGITIEPDILSCYLKEFQSILIRREVDNIK